MKNYEYYVRSKVRFGGYEFYLTSENGDLETLSKEAALDFDMYCSGWVLPVSWPLTFEIFHNGESLGTRTITTETIYRICD
ncbi:MAG: hypothetical protein KAS32_08570 [Candidatus Peribacteraceae bacterium]|nr:hypothetical protein [Candidatus Peribacteraceae bacterium]